MTKKLKKEFLAHIENGARVIDAAKSIGFHHSRLYRIRDEDEEFAKAWDEAKQVGASAKLGFFEKVADRRAVKGWLEPVYHKGVKVGHIRRFSDRLLIIRMKAEAKRADDPSYSERIEHSGKIGGGPLGITLEFVSTNAPDSDT